MDTERRRMINWLRRSKKALPLLFTSSSLAYRRLDGIIVQELEPGAAVEESHERSRWWFRGVSGTVVVVINGHLRRWTVRTEPLTGSNDGSGRLAIHGLAGTVTEVTTVLKHEKRFDVFFVQVFCHRDLVVVIAPSLAVHNTLAVKLDVIINIRGYSGSLVSRVVFVIGHWLAGRS